MTTAPATPPVLRRRAARLFLELADRRDLAYRRQDDREAEMLNPFVILAGHLALLGAAVDGPTTARVIESVIRNLQAITAAGRSPSAEEAERFDRSLQALGGRIGQIMNAPPLH